MPTPVAVTVGVPAAVPRNQKVALEAPAATSTEATGATPQPAASWKVKPAAGAADSATAVSAATGATLPWTSRASIVTAPEHPPAASVCGADVKTSRSGAAGT